MAQRDAGSTGWRNTACAPMFATMLAAAPPVQVTQAPDGTTIYLVDHSPAELPAVHGRDLLLAWDAARAAALGAPHGTCRDAAGRFRFRRADGGFTDLALHDRDAACWAAASAATQGLHTAHGVSVCLRLLALVDLLARAPGWTHGLFTLRGGAMADLHPALLRAAATAPLTDDGRFEDAPFRARLGRPTLSDTAGAPA